MRVRIYLKSGQVIKLRGVEKLEYVPGRTIKWKLTTRKWFPIHISPDEIIAITQHTKWWP